jgi:short-subunit dehydrogenase
MPFLQYTLPDNLTKIYLKQVDPKQFSCAVLINNAGSLGDKIKSIPNHTDVDKIRMYMDLNITSSFYLT